MNLFLSEKYKKSLLIGSFDGWKSAFGLEGGHSLHPPAAQMFAAVLHREGKHADRSEARLRPTFQTTFLAWRKTTRDHKSFAPAIILSTHPEENCKPLLVAAWQRTVTLFWSIKTVAGFKAWERPLGRSEKCKQYDLIPGEFERLPTEKRNEHFSLNGRFVSTPQQEKEEWKLRF